MALVAMTTLVAILFSGCGLLGGGSSGGSSGGSGLGNVVSNLPSH